MLPCCYLFVLSKSYVKSFFVSEGAIFSSVTYSVRVHFACSSRAGPGQSTHHRKKRKIDSFMATAGVTYNDVVLCFFKDGWKEYTRNASSCTTE